MLLTLKLETFKQLDSKTSPLYYLERSDGYTLYMAKPPMILKAEYNVGIDEETGVPKTEDKMMFFQSFLSADAVQIESAQERAVVEMIVRQA